MNRSEVITALHGVSRVRRRWKVALRKHEADINSVMARLLHEAARERMSVEDVARYSGLTPKRVRFLMRAHGLDPRSGRNLLAHQAAAALEANAVLLGVEPRDMDLMSPLAYLPMGKDMRKFLETDEENDG